MLGPEDFGRWTEGGGFKLRFRQPLPNAFTLVLKFGALSPNVGKPTVVRVGKEEKVINVSSPVGTEYSLEFKDVQSDTVEIIPFVHSVPHDIDPKNPDKRDLGLAMVYLKIK